MNRFLWFIYAVTLVFPLFQTNAQVSDSSRYFIEASVQSGRIIRHTLPFPEINRNSVVTEINFTKQTSGEKLWQQLYNRPLVGLAATYGFLGDEKTLGHAIAILPNITFRKQKKSTGFFWRLGSGIAYLNKPYSIFTNESNNVIGSQINNMTQVKLGIEWKLRKLFLQTSLSLTHYSNGRAKLPNLGYNIPSLSVTARLPVAEKNTLEKTDSIVPVFNKIHIGVELEHGFYQLRTSRGPEYTVYGGEIFITKDFTLKNRLFAGIGYVYDAGVYQLIVTTENFKGQQKLYASRISGFVAHEFLLDHIGLLTQAGIFFNNPFLLSHRFPTKLGVKYYVYNPYYKKRNQIYLGFYLNAHSFEADYVGFGAGYFF